MEGKEPTAETSSPISESYYHSKGLESLKGRHLTSIADLSVSELSGLLSLSLHLKQHYKHNEAAAARERPLDGKSLAMIFMKRSTRTRVSTETGTALLGGHALFLGPQDIQLGVNESMRDTAHVLSRYNSAILARVFSHEAEIGGLCQWASVPVINALSDLHHPLQALADIMTLAERFGGLEALKGRTVSWVGDGNNVFHDLALAAVKLGMHVSIGCPQGYEPNAAVMDKVRQLANDSTQAGVEVRVSMCNQPREAVKGADVVVTDTWVSMGQESDKATRMQHFEGYQVTEELMGLAQPHAVFLHCLPRHPEEVDDKVFYSNRSLVFDEAENRMWTVMAVLLAALGK